MCVLGGGGGGGTSLSHAERGAQKSFSVVLTQELEVLAILKEGHNKFPSFKRRGVG